MISLSHMQELQRLRCGKAEAHEGRRERLAITL
jgi:hypothetical protein